MIWYNTKDPRKNTKAKEVAHGPPGTESEINAVSTPEWANEACVRTDDLTEHSIEKRNFDCWLLLSKVRDVNLQTEKATNLGDVQTF